jgi:hypothetical protein
MLKTQSVGGTELYDVVADADGKTWVSARIGMDSVAIYQYDGDGLLLVETHLAGTERAALISDGSNGVYVGLASDTGYDFWLYRLSASGQTLGFWSRANYYTLEHRLFRLSPQRFVMAAHVSGAPTSYLKLFYFDSTDPTLGYDALINLSGENRFRDLTILSDSSFVVVGGDWAPSLQNYYAASCYIASDTIGSVGIGWIQQYNDIGLSQAGTFLGSSAIKSDGDFYVFGSDHLDKISVEGDFMQTLPLASPAVDLYDDSDSSFVLYQSSAAFGGLLTYWIDGQSTASQKISGIAPKSVSTFVNGDWLISGRAANDLGDSVWVVSRFARQWTDFKGQIYGTLWHDTAENCTLDSSEMRIVNRLVLASRVSDGLSLGAFTDSLGQYQIAVDTGVWEVSTQPLNWYWSLCQASQTITIDGLDTVAADFGAQIVVYCPLLNIDLGAPLLRRCFNNVYTIEYQNDGSTTAVDAYLDLQLDEFLTVISTSQPYTSISNDQIRFELGDVLPGTGGTITAVLYLDCDSTIIGQTHCVTATVYPDTLCVLTNADWAGAKIEVEADCVGDTAVVFTLSNNKPAAMVDTKLYTIIEDLIIMLQIPYDLDGNDSIKIIRPANGQTIRLKAQQDTGYPEFSQPTIAVEGCGAEIPDSIHLGYVLAFPEDNPPVHFERFCMESIGSFDPNDKTGYPKGVGPEGFIEPNTRLDYLIRFQNTGTDTAFNIVVRDTLQATLDIRTIDLGAKSHDYQVSIEGDSILIFTFANIMLPDSNINELGSHGFFKFSINHKAGLPLGTVLENTAHIYFDFNEVVVTNTTKHTLAENFLTVAEPSATTDVEIFDILISPQPVSSCAAISWASAKSGDIQVYDHTGRLVYHELNVKSGTTFCPDNLPQGAYYIKIVSDQRLYVGRLMLTRL